MRIYSPTYGYIANNPSGVEYTSDPLKAAVWPNEVSAQAYIRLFTELNGGNDLEVSP